ncbi:MAG: SCP2 sterol-binding domain-containing protein, partial [Spirochaetales bacterium]|nr:SCP2 sterol-binding domain-containing protein [Spirochaetales bacterium]
MERQELEGLLEEQRLKYSDERVAKNFKGWNKAMQYHFTDTGDYYVLRMANGEPRPVERLEGPLEKPDIQYEMDTETLRAMTRKELSGLQAYQQKRIKL